MTLLKTVSERLDNKGVPFTDFYLGWVDKDGSRHLVRVRPQFWRCNSLLEANAVNVPQGEALEKYI